MQEQQNYKKMIPLKRTPCYNTQAHYMMKHLSLFFGLALGAFAASGQTCDCSKHYEWLKSAFEENDAGFQYILDKKGQQAYDIHNTITKNRIAGITQLDSCAVELNEWLRFFRKGHLGLEISNARPVTAMQAPAKSLKTDPGKFKKYLDKKTTKDYEGIWKLDGYEIIVQHLNGGYTGTILSAENKSWKPEQIKFTINRENKGTFFMGDHSPKTINQVELLGEDVMRMDAFYLKRIYAQKETDKNIQEFMQAMTARSPYGYKRHENTVYLRIPSFGDESKRAIDSVIAGLKTGILQSRNLIIDLRGNGGGSDNSFNGLLPFIYTTPIRTVFLEFLSTKHNNKRWQEQLNEPGISEDDKKEIRDICQKLDANLGKFINLFDTEVMITKFDTVYPNPQQIAVIIDGQNASTTEQFLLAAKQSKKVKLFGSTTYGALDISNMYELESPDKSLILHYCLSKSLRIPELSIDDKGIEPDFYLDRQIPGYRWLDHVDTVLNP